MKNLVELSQDGTIVLAQEGKPVGRVTDVRNGSIMEFAFFLNKRKSGDGYNFSSKYSHSYPVKPEDAGGELNVWKEKKSFSSNDFPRMQRLAGKADDLDQELRQQLKQELKAITKVGPTAVATPSPSL